MSGFAILITNAGRAALVATGGTNAVRITQFGYTATSFTAAAGMTTLPGELGRVDTIAGQAVDATTIHLTVRDSSSASYTMRGFAFYLEDGTLFAAYGQSTPIMDKASASVLLAAFDVGMLAGDVDVIQFGTANFTYPPATQTVKGVAELATQTEVNAGTDNQRIVTPLTLATRIAALLTSIGNTLAGYVQSTRTVATDGLATGGGTLAADRTISVQAATTAEAEAGTSTSKALTPASIANILTNIGAKAVASRSIATSGLATGGGSLAADRTIDVAAATAAEADAGTITTKAVTPGALANILASIANKVVSARQVLTSGLATGGGNLTADRTIDVPAASAADVQAGSSISTAITPNALRSAQSYASGVNGERIDEFGYTRKWGKVTGGYTGEVVVNVVFPVAFVTACDNIDLTGFITAANIYCDLWPEVIEESITATGFSIQLQADDSDDNFLQGIFYRAIGR